MICRLNDALRNAILECMFNGGTPFAFFDSAGVEFRTGGQPASANSAATGTVCESITLPADAMGAATGGTISKTATAWQDLSSDADGEIGYARFKSADNTLVMDVDVTDNDGDGFIKIDNPVVVVGQEFVITDFAVTMPAST